MLTKNGYRRGLSWIDEVSLRKIKPAYSTPLGAMFNTDSAKVLSEIPSDSVDLVMTSPPFALTRKKEYGNESIERYLDWFTPFCLEIHRILKPTGSFVLDIGGAWIPGVPVRSVYHFDLAVRLAKEFYLAQEFYWYNPAKLPTPAEWVTVRRVRVKDAVNMLWWFSKTEWPKADNRCVLQPYSDSMKSLLKNGYKAKKRPSGHDILTKFQKDNGGAIRFIPICVLENSGRRWPAGRFISPSQFNFIATPIHPGILLNVQTQRLWFATDRMISA